MPLLPSVVTVEGMAWGISVVGLVVVMALRDIFHTLWHPSGTGDIAKAVSADVWRATGRVAPRRVRHLAGPPVRSRRSTPGTRTLGKTS